MIFIFALFYQLKNYEIEGKTQIEIEYQVNNACKIYITFSKGYEVYKLETEIKGQGKKIINLSEAKIIPTRRKPYKMPLTIEGNCDGKISNVIFK